MNEIRSRIIAHLDMDAFFASVEERDKPYLKGEPLVIGSDPKGGEGRGVVSTASYAARAYGVHSALPITKAWTLCEAARKKGKPMCIFIDPSIRKYGNVSREVFAIVEKYVPTIAQTSVDEAYLDLSFCGSYEKARALATKIKSLIKKEARLTCSIGIGPNKLVAKVASDFQKPEGLTIVASEDVQRFLEPMHVRVIPGIGPKAATTFMRRGIEKIADARKLSWEEMERLFGKNGFSMYERIRGVDLTPLVVDVARKSIGLHDTFSVDTHDMEYILKKLEHMAATIFQSLQLQKYTMFRTVVFTVRFADFETHTKSLTKELPMKSKSALALSALKLALPFFDTTGNPHSKRIRLIGLRVEKLS